MHDNRLDAAERQRIVAACITDLPEVYQSASGGVRASSRLSSRFSRLWAGSGVVKRATRRPVNPSAAKGARERRIDRDRGTAGAPARR